MPSVLTTIFGGLLAGSSATGLMLSVGQVAGMSGMLYGVLTQTPGDWIWKAVYTAGVAASALMLKYAGLGAAAWNFAGPWSVIAASGFLVGFGVTLGNGCPSGHGICGLPRFSPRSFAAVGTFFSVAAVVANVVGPDTSTVAILATAAAATAVGVVVRLNQSKNQPRIRVAPPPEQQVSSPVQLATVFVLAALFGTGLIVGGMANPGTVKHFLKLDGEWDESLFYFLTSALASSFIGFQMVKKQDKPALACKHVLPTSSVITPELVVGAALFGIGWGLQGVCPGPAIIALANMSESTVIYWAGLLVGMSTHYIVDEVGIDFGIRRALYLKKE